MSYLWRTFEVIDKKSINCFFFAESVFVGFFNFLAFGIIKTFIISEEISRQLINSGAKVIFGLSAASKIIQEAVELTKSPIRIVYIRSTPAESLPANGIAFDELISLNG
jgi:hypothetical protein